MDFTIYFDEAIVWDQGHPYLKIRIPNNCYFDMRKGILNISNTSVSVRLYCIEENIWIKLNNLMLTGILSNHVKGELHIKGYKIMQILYEELSSNLSMVNVDINSISKRDIRQGMLFILESKDSETRLERISMFIKAYTNI